MRHLASSLLTVALGATAWMSAAGLSAAEAAPPKPGAHAPDTTQVAPMLDQGRYAEAARAYADLYAKAPSPELLFNAAFYYGRAGQLDKATPLARKYTETVTCHAPAKLQPREIRHCALAAEMLGNLQQALTLFEDYQKRAEIWAHRSRAEDDVQRVQLKMKISALETEMATLKAKK